MNRFLKYLFPEFNKKWRLLILIFLVLSGISFLLIGRDVIGFITDLKDALLSIK